MNKYFYDFHIHTSRSFRCSKKLTQETINTKLKEYSILPLCYDSFTSSSEEEYSSQEIIDKNQVHHLLLFKTILRKKICQIFLPYSSNIKNQGRPQVSLDHGQIGRLLAGIDVVYGAAHCFSPKTGLFKLKNISSSYMPHFLEIGIDLNPTMIPTLKTPVFSFSDAHSLEKIGRSYTEFNQPLDVVFNLLLKRNFTSSTLKLYCCPVGYGKYSVRGCYRCKKEIINCNCRSPKISYSSIDMIQNIPTAWKKYSTSKVNHVISSWFNSKVNYNPGCANKYGRLKTT